MKRPRSGLRVLIVDDEAPARRKVRRFLDTEPDVLEIREAVDGPGAVEAMRDQEPDLVFLDIQMPGLDGFGVLDALPAGATPKVVFVTAFDDFAVRAFEVHAVDYLLKPFDAGRFTQAFARAREAVRAPAGDEERNRLRALLAELASGRQTEEPRLLVDAGEKSVLLRAGEVERVEAAGNYARVHSGGRVFRLRATITDLERRLKGAGLLRVNRSTLVHADGIAEVAWEPHGDAVIRLKGGGKVRLSRRYRHTLTRFR